MNKKSNEPNFKWVEGELDFKKFGLRKLTKKQSKKILEQEILKHQEIIAKSQNRIAELKTIIENLTAN